MSFTAKARIINFNQPLKEDVGIKYFDQDFSGLSLTKQEILSRTAQIRDLKIKINKSKIGFKGAYDFEDMCYEIIKVIFSTEFYKSQPIWHPYSITNKGRRKKVRDITLIIKLHKNQYPEPGCIWNIFKEYTDCKNITFECKNYAKTTKVTKKEISQLRDYLYPDTLGRFGIILNQFGIKNLNEKAIKEIERLYREKYIVFVFGKKDIINWIDEWIQCGSSENFFTKKYNDLLILISDR